MKAQNLKSKLVPDFDNTFYWCGNCKIYQRFLIYDVSYGPYRVVCQRCHYGYRLAYLRIIESKHPAICST